MTATLWFVMVGLLLVGMALASTFLRRVPVSVAMLYVAVGVAVGPQGLGLIELDPVRQAAVLERITEVVVVVSLFSAGLKLRSPLSDPIWRRPARLAFLSMTLTVAGVAAAGVWVAGLPLGAAILLGAILAPTDPVLASDVQVEHPHDRDRLRFSLTGEAGLNDGTAFPFVMLGLGLLGLHELGAGWWRWIAIDVVWAILGGLAIGSACGWAVGHWVVHLRREHAEALGLDDFLGLGLIALSYGLALLLSAYGFLAVFAAGLALRRIERASEGPELPPAEVVAVAEEEEAEDAATDPETAPAYMAQAVLAFSEQLERIGTVAVVVLLGGMLTQSYLSRTALWIVPLLLLVIRPLAVRIGLAGTERGGTRRTLIAWFGIRGIGSVYYLSYAVAHGLPRDLAEVLTAVTLFTVVTSIVLHGLTVPPLMKWYVREDGEGEGAGASS